MQILVKLPSRGRPKEVLNALSKAIKLANNNSKITYLLTLDRDDPRTNNATFDKVLGMIKGVEIIIDRGVSTGKINACNRGVDLVKDWDILLLLSDDMICIAQGWDDILRDKMTKHFVDGDGILFFNDGFCGKALNTLCILGRKYYDRFGYIYNPEYKSLWCDNEFMTVGNILKRQIYFDQIIFRHEHPANTGKPMDDLYNKNDRYYNTDKKTFDKRRAKRFNL